MHGASPFECKFVKIINHHHHHHHHRSGSNNNDGSTIRVAKCSQLHVLGQMPHPMPNSTLDCRYDRNFPELMDFVEWMLTQDRLLYPNIGQVVARLDVLFKKVSGTWC